MSVRVSVGQERPGEAGGFCTTMQMLAQGHDTLRYILARVGQLVPGSGGGGHVTSDFC